MGKLIFPVVLLSCALQLTQSGSDKETPVRTLRNEDILTPKDFLPVAKKLLEKVEYPGVGKGIVSSSKTYQQLADKLFQRYFFTNARFAALRVYDLAGLDSLQALALSGDDFEPSRQFVPLQKTDFFKGLPVRCRYKLMTKKNEEKKNAKHSPKKAPISQSARRRKIGPHVIPEAKKLHKNRVLVVKSKRKKRDTITEEKDKADNKKENDTRRHRIKPASAPNIDTTAPPKAKDYVDMDFESRMELAMYNKMNFQPPEKIDKEKCYWRYKCPDNKWAFFTCELYPECEGTKSDHFIRDDIPIAHRVDEHQDDLISFRREVGVFLVDEEVEKILGHRYFLLIYPSQVKKAAEASKEEHGIDMEKKFAGANLQSYFQNLVQAERGTSTMAPEIKKRKQWKSKHVYKYLKAKNPYNNPKMQKRIEEAHMEKLRPAEEKQQKAVISWGMADTTPLPDFMHRMKK
ncbi:hypothetical protein NE865_15039 [Phthorimaea operculella]|nr:hypothetical protein NE865_15039 [Phthorimaea operculella]